MLNKNGTLERNRELQPKERSGEDRRAAGSPIKGCQSRAKTFPMQIDFFFSLFDDQLSTSVPLPQFLYVLQCQPLLHQSPIGI